MNYNYDGVLNPVFGTHLPVLAALDPQPQRVLEFGTGYFSTKAFLMMDSVVELTSIEDDPEWRERMRWEFGPRGSVWEEYTETDFLRWTLLSAEDEVPPFENFDLIFVDDGRDPQGSERLATTEYVLSQPHPKAVFHDVDFQPFLDAIHRLTGGTGYEVYRDLTPHTAVVEANA